MNGQQNQAQKDYGLYLTAIVFNIYGKNTQTPFYHATIEFNDFIAVEVDIKKTKQGEFFVSWPQSEFLNRNNQKQYKHLFKFIDRNASNKINEQILGSFAGGQCLNWVAEGSTFYARQQQQQPAPAQQGGYPQQAPPQQYAPQQVPPPQQYPQQYPQQAPAQTPVPQYPPQQYPPQQPAYQQPYQQPAVPPQQYQQPPAQQPPQVPPQQPPQNPNRPPSGGAF